MKYTLSFIQPIGSRNTSSVADISNIFVYQRAFNQSIESWGASNKVTNMKSMFAKQRAFNQPISNWDISKVSTIYYMFALSSPLGAGISLRRA